MVLSEPPGLAAVRGKLAAPLEVVRGDVVEAPSQLPARTAVSLKDDAARIASALQHRHGQPERRAPDDTPGLPFGIEEANRRAHRAYSPHGIVPDPDVLKRAAIQDPADQQLPGALLLRVVVVNRRVLNVPRTNEGVED